jgi:hypothetical protein
VKFSSSADAIRADLIGINGITTAGKYCRLKKISPLGMASYDGVESSVSVSRTRLAAQKGLNMSLKAIHHA